MNKLKDYDYIVYKSSDGTNPTLLVEDTLHSFSYTTYYDDTLNYIVDRFSFSAEEGVFDPTLYYDTAGTDIIFVLANFWGTNVSDVAEMVTSDDTYIFDLEADDTFETVSGKRTTGWMRSGTINTFAYLMLRFVDVLN